MKNSIFLSLFVLVFFVACGGSSTSKDTTTETTDTTTDVVVLDSLSNEMDEVSTEIENNAKALEEALLDLE